MPNTCMKTALLASRNLNSLDHYEMVAATLASLGTTEIHHGGSGAGRIHAQRWAAQTGNCQIEHAPNWKEHGKAAGPIRGKELITAADNVVALWDGISKGTAHEMKEARRQGKRVLLLLV